MFDGRKLKRLRQEKNLTLQELGNSMGGMPLTTVFQLEKKNPETMSTARKEGKKIEDANVQLSTLLKACTALDCSIYDLLTSNALLDHEDALRILLKDLETNRPRYIREAKAIQKLSSEA